MSYKTTIRDCIGEFVGKTIVDITQHDEEHFKRTGEAFVDLMFDSGDVLRVYAQAGWRLCVKPGEGDEEEVEME